MEDRVPYRKQTPSGSDVSAIKGGGVIGIDFGATQLRAALVTEHGIGQIQSSVTPNAGTKDDVWQAIKSLIQEVIDRNDANIPAAICVGVPSVVDTVTGTVYDFQHIPAVKELHLGEMITRAFGTLSLINNDANAFALGEYYFGDRATEPLPAKENTNPYTAKTMTHSMPLKNYTTAGSRQTRIDPKALNRSVPSPNSSLIGLTLGTGLGAGLILDGKLYSGPNCGAGEIGCIPYLDANLERYVSGAFFNRGGLNGKAYYDKALQGDQKALNVYKEFGHHLGQAIKIAMYAYDPDKIVLGGSVSQAFDLYKENMLKSMRDFDYPGILKKIQVYPSKLQHSAILGAASLYFDYAKHQ